MDLSALSGQWSSLCDQTCVLWGCELKDGQRTAVFEAEDDLMEHQFFIRTICLSAEASPEMHVVEVQDAVGVSSDLVPIATLHPVCQPMVSFTGFELTPPVTFQLRSGRGPLFICGQHLTFGPEDEEEEEEEEELEPKMLRWRNRLCEEGEVLLSSTPIHVNTHSGRRTV